MTPDSPIEKLFRNHTVVILLGLFLVVDVLSIGLINREDPPLAPAPSVVERTVSGDTGGIIPKLSQINVPMIDSEAAAVVLETKSTTLPVRVWVFLLVAYVALLIFNLTYDFDRATKVQWGIEVILTVLTLLAWYAWDTAGATLWFPLAVMKMGILIYAVYLYFFDRKMLRQSLEGERFFAE